MTSVGVGRTTESALQPVPILLYHCIGDDTSGPLGRYTLSVRDFRDHMAWIADSGYSTLTVSQYVDTLADRRPLPHRPLLITFDDGFADFVRNALDVLVAHGHVSTMYVTTAGTWRSRPRKLGGRATLSWHEVAGLKDGGVEVGGHGHHHLQLDLLPAARVQSEVRGCREVLEQVTGDTVTSFAYPHGYNRATTRRLVQMAGFSSACAVRNQVSHPGDDRWALARIMLTVGTTVDDLRWTLGRAGENLARRPAPLRTSAWRAVRALRTRGRPVVEVVED
jgi:peptidoglycan/xylan/chitin deacetylase (PgdA/CDA1 family)